LVKAKAEDKNQNENKSIKEQLHNKMNDDQNNAEITLKFTHFKVDYDS